MSGSGSDPTTNGGSGGEGILCENLSFTTAISSPQEEEVNHIHPSMDLPVLYRDGRVLIVLEDTGNTVGSINWTHIDKLIECMQTGTVYMARVLSVDGGRIQIRVAAVDD